MNIGSRIYYEKSTGNVILRTPEVLGGRQSTVEEDFESFAELNQRVPETIGMVHFEYGQHEQDFAVSIPTQVVNGEVLWTPFPNSDGTEPIPQKAFSEQILEMKQNQVATNRAVDETSTTQQQLLELLDELGVIS